MNGFSDYLSSGHAWLYVPVAILLGALHGLEPGHSKTMMAAFIIAIRGTVLQAVLLGLSAAISHSLLIWVLAGLALHYGEQWNATNAEPYFHLASAAMILGLALWMFLRTRREVAEEKAHLRLHEEEQQHEKKDSPTVQLTPQYEPDPWAAASHSHESSPRLLTGETITPGGLILPAGTAAPAAVPVSTARQGRHGGLLLDTGHGWLEVCTPPSGDAHRFHIYPCKASGEKVPLPKNTKVALETARLDGRTQKFAFESKGDHWEAGSEVQGPLEFMAVITLGHSDHAHTYRLRFSGIQHGEKPVVEVADEDIDDSDVEYQDAHERAHARDIARRFANRTVTTPQIVLFGITGGLMPCPAAFTVLLICLQIKKVVLGFALVAAFSFGLALTMVVVGVIAAWGVNHAHRRITGFSTWMRRAPYLSCVLLVLLAAFMAWQGWQGLVHPHPHTH